MPLKRFGNRFMLMDVVWLNQFKLNRFETGLSASINGAYDNHTQLHTTFHTIKNLKLACVAHNWCAKIQVLKALIVHMQL